MRRKRGMRNLPMKKTKMKMMTKRKITSQKGKMMRMTKTKRHQMKTGEIRVERKMTMMTMMKSLMKMSTSNRKEITWLKQCR